MKRRTLSMILILCMVVGMLPTNIFATIARAEEGSEPATVSMDALVTETEITVDGAFDETAWSSWVKIPAAAEGAPSGGLAAVWDLENLYLAINAMEADTARLTVNGTAVTVDMATGAVTGAKNAQGAAVNGAVEVSIPLTSLGISLSEYGQSVDISASLAKNDVTSTLTANKLCFTGKTAAVADFSSLTVGTDLLFLNCDYSIDGNAATLAPTSGTSYFIDASHTIDLKSGFMMSYELEFAELPVIAQPSYAGGVYTGFSHYVMAADKDNMYYSIYRPSEDGDLMLAVVYNGMAAQSTFPLNRGLNEKFQFTYAVHPDKSVDFFVDGEYVGTVENAVFTGTGKSWSYWRFTAPILGNSSFTISNVKTLQTKHTGSLPVATGNLDALVAEDSVQVDGTLTESVWSNWTKVMPAEEGAPSGGVAAAWDLENLYLAISAKEADTAQLTVNGTAVTVDLSDGIVTGAENAQIAAANGVVEVSIPLTSLDIDLSEYGQSVDIFGSLTKDGARSLLAANKLCFTGKTAAVADYSSLAVGTDLLFLNCDYSIDGNAATLAPTSGTSYFIDASHTIDLKSGFLMSYDLEFTELPVIAEPSYAGGVYTGFSHFVMAADKDNVYYSIYRPSEDGDLMLAVVYNGMSAQSTFPLNRGLNEKFQLTYAVHPDGSMDFFVDGEYVGTVENTVFTGTGKSWSYWRFTAPILGNSSFTISNVKTLQSTYTGSLPVTGGTLEALVAEDAMQLDATLSEPFWGNWAEIMPSTDNAPSGEVAAAWDFVNLYLAINADADMADLSVNGKKLTVDLSAGTVTGMEDAISAGSSGVVEIVIPMDSLGIAVSEYGQSVGLSVSLSKDGDTSKLEADRLVLSGKISVMNNFLNALVTLACTVSEDGASATLTKTKSYMLFVTPDIDMSKEFVVSNYLEFEDIPVYTNSYLANGFCYEGYNQYFVDPSANGVIYSIYRADENSGLTLVMRGKNGTEDCTFELNRGLNQKFKLTCVVYADGSAELFVDDASLGVVPGAVHRMTGFGNPISGWRNFGYNTAQDDFAYTVSDVSMLQTKYGDVVSPPKQTMEALAAENDVIVNGILNKLEWSNYFKIPASVAGAPSGGVSAIWDRDNLYFAFNAKDATTAQMTLDSHELTINLANGTVTGVENAQGAVGTHGEVEIAIPWTALGIQGSAYEMEIPMSVTLVGEDASSVSSVKKLIITGMVMSQIEINSFSPNTVFTQEGETVTMKASRNGADNYFLYQSDAISMAGEFLESYNLKITKLPVSTPAYSGGQYTGFSHYFVGAYNSNRETQRVTYGIYRPSEDSGLMLVVRGNMGIKDFTFALNRDLGEEFRLSCLVHADGSADFFVDGDYLGTVKGAVSLVTGFGLSMSLWRYRESGEEADAEITVSQVGRMEQKYPSLNDMLKIPYILGRSLSMVTGDLNLPNVLPNSEIFGDIPITWQSSDESVLAADGTVTRHETEVRRATLTLLYNGEVKDTAEVTIRPVYVVDYPGTGVLTVGFAGTPVVMDGSVAEEGWAMHGRMVNAKSILVAEFGAQWDADYLYLAVDTVTKDVPFVVALNGKAFHISGGKLLDSSDAEVAGSTVATKNSVAEIKIPVAALGLTDSNNNPMTRIAEYDYKVPIALTVAEVSYEGTLHLSSIDWWVVENTETQLPHPAGHTATIASGGGAPDGNQGVEKVASGYRMYDLYSETGSNPASVRSYATFWKQPIYENFGDRTVAIQVNFDFVANALPVYDEVTGIVESQIYSNYGFNFWWCDEADAAKNANCIVAGIIRMEDGLYFVMTGTPVEMVKLNRQVGESFNVGMTWEANGDLVLSIDGEVIHTFIKAGFRGNSWGNSSFIMNLLRNNTSPTSSADDIDVTIRNFAFGRNYNQENMLQWLTFSDICGENTSEESVTKNLGTLPTVLEGYGPFLDSFDIAWTSSHPDLISETGVVNLPETGAQQVTLIASLVDNFGRTHTKSFVMIVSSGEFDNSNVLYVNTDLDPANTPGVAGYAEQLFTFDATNNSIVAVLDAVQPVNVVVLKDMDDAARLNTQNLTLWVSDDNVTYTRVESFKLLQAENKWYLYDFSINAKYVKVHYTHYDSADASFFGVFEDMITADYHDVFGGENAEFTESTYTLTNRTGKTQRDYAFPIAKSDLGITGTDASIRLYLDGELLYHYVDGDTVYVRIRDLAAGASVTLTVKQSDDETVMDIANKEAVYEVTYGTIESHGNPTLNIGRWILTLPAGTVFPDKSVLEKETILSIKTGYILASQDSGKTWFKWANTVNNAPEGKTPVHDGFWGDGGWIFDEHTGRIMFHLQDGTSYKYVANNMKECYLTTRIIASDDGGKTWYIIDEFDPDPEDVHSQYMLSYMGGITLSCYDGEGPNVDMVFPIAAMYNDHTALCGRVAYSRDGGETWQRSETLVINGMEAAYEGGISEGSILEREDGVLVMYLRSQSLTNVRFAVSYSLDHGVTWTSMAIPSSVYSTGTQPVLMRYDFDGTEAPIMVWGGNNATGAVSHVRNPASFAVSTNDMETFRNIQNLYSKTFLEHYGSQWTHIFSNPTVGQINGDGIIIGFTPGSSSTIATMVVDNFTDWFTRTKGLYDSFEHGTTHYEGWVTVKGSTAVTGDQKVSGKYSMLVDHDSVVTRSVPYLQNGSVEISIYVGENSNFTLQLQSAFAKIYNGEGMPIGLRVENNKLYLNNETTPVATLNANAWNAFVFDLEMTEDKASVAVNGGEAIVIPVITENGDYVCSLTLITEVGQESIYVDEVLVQSELDAVLEATTTDKTAAKAVIELIKSIGDVTIEDAELIASIRETYEAMSQVQQDLVNRNVPSGTSTNANDEGAMINYYQVLVEAEEVIKTLTPELPAITGNLSLNDTVDINFIIPAGIDVEENVLVVKNAATGEDVEYTLLPMTDDTTVVRFSAKSNHMTDEITVQVFDSNGNALTQMASMSVRKYAQKLFVNCDDTLKMLLIRMLDYGALAQINSGVTTDLANSIVTDELRAFANNYKWDDAVNLDIPAGSGGVFQAYLALNETIDVTVSVASSYVGAGDKFVVKRNGVELSEDDYILVEQSNSYLIRCSVNSDEMTDEIYIAIVGEDGAVKKETTLGVRIYAQKFLAAVSTGNQAAMILAMLDYGAMAQIYAKTNTEDLANCFVTDAMRQALIGYTWP